MLPAAVSAGITFRYAVSLKLKLYFVLLAAVPLAAQTLRDLADQRGIHIGSAADPQYLTESAFAAANNMVVRGHTLVWHQQNPAWLTGGNYSPSQLSAILLDHINTVVGHY